MMTTRMPYKETEEYVNNLVSRATEQAIRQQHGQPSRAKISPLRSILAAAAVLALLLTAGGLTYYHTIPSPEEMVAEKTEQQLSPVDQFLTELSDEEAQLLAYYEIEEIPEY